MKPLQHRILDLLADGPKHFGELCERLLPSPREAIRAALVAMKHDGKIRTCGFYQVGHMGQLSIWEKCPVIDPNVLLKAWPMPVAFPPVVCYPPRVHAQ